MKSTIIAFTLFAAVFGAPVRRQTGNVQTFTGALGGIAATPVENTGDSKRPFSVKGTTFTTIGAALTRSCDQQFNACANAANGGDASLSVAQCSAQKSMPPAFRLHMFYTNDMKISAAPTTRCFHGGMRVLGRIRVVRLPESSEVRLRTRSQYPIAVCRSPIEQGHVETSSLEAQNSLTQPGSHPAHLQSPGHTFLAPDINFEISGISFIKNMNQSQCEIRVRIRINLDLTWRSSLS